MTPVIPSSPVTSTVWSGINLLSAFEFASRWLDHNRESVNALNVFPVPDGDTGTNMSLTLRSAIDGARTAPEPLDIGSVAAKLAQGALMGARGNSGVILSQILRGFASGLADLDRMDSDALARSLHSASQLAYKAVIEPVEGTMLTVMRESARSASSAAVDSSTPLVVLHAALNGAREALARTPEQLDILRQAGVVDAGGRGVVLILEGLCRFAEGDILINDQKEEISQGAEMRFLDDLQGLHGEESFGYCTNFIIFGNDMDFDHVRSTIAGMGGSAVIVGDHSLIKVHIHTEHPGSVLEYAVTIGQLDQIKIENMMRQTEALAEQRAHARGTEAPTSHAPVIDGTIGIVAVAAGAGLASALESMGAHVIVSGGQTMNPSTMQILDAVRQIPVDNVIILPNNKNIIMAAKQISALTDKSVRVIPTNSVPQGLAALARFSREASLDSNADRMSAALGDVHSIEITRAVRDVHLNGISVAAGDLLSLVDGDLIAAGTDFDDIVARSLTALARTGPELLTIFTGDEATPDATAAIERHISETFPDAEIEIVDGDQPHYPYLIAAE